MNKTNTVHEQVSALADGHLQDDEFAQVIDKLGVDDDLRATWQTYHLVGDVLRSGVHARCSDTALFLSRLQGPACSGTHDPVLDSGTPHGGPGPAPHRSRQRAGIPLEAGRRCGVPGCGGRHRVELGRRGRPRSLRCSVGRGAAGDADGRGCRPATSSGPDADACHGGQWSPQIMLRDPRLDQLLEAHQQTGGASQMPSGFLRNATFERPSR
jgi:sigma-E factor negative regulatory protein RseA